MYRVALFLFALFASIAVTIASPLPETYTNATTVDLEKRVTHVGRGTWFHVGLGNCGKRNVDSDPIVAISKKRYDANGGANCDQWVEIVNTKNGKKAYGKTRDSCESCSTEDLDMSPSLFSKLDNPSVGVLKISWHFMAKGWSP
ncbi:RlpA-like double-psi beta-barrel-protein domain-containing protein-containing protein [Lyophyllum atratum]|nr:RlpA-like double-psi beta-barrel-protein domain-containing protein-containing protein [Lyophyllum atratum]